MKWTDRVRRELGGTSESLEGITAGPLGGESGDHGVAEFGNYWPPVLVAAAAVGGIQCDER